MNLKPDPSLLDEDAFVAAFGGVYEHSPWIARAVWQDMKGKVPTRAADLAKAMAAVLAQADGDAKLALLRAHPDLAGKAALAGNLTTESHNEQAGAGLDQCSAEEFARFGALNAAYTQKFDFPFIVAVKGMDRHGILAQFAARLGNSYETEFETALGEVNKIARLRLEALEQTS